jgi:hypothetical protein
LSSWDNEHVHTPKRSKGLKPSVHLAWYPNENLPQESCQWVTSKKTRSNEYAPHWDSSDVMDSCGGLRAGADTGNLSIRKALVEITKDCLESAFVAQVTQAKIPKKADLLWLHSNFFKISLLMSPVLDDCKANGRLYCILLKKMRFLVSLKASRPHK